MVTEVRCPGITVEEIMRTGGHVDGIGERVVTIMAGFKRQVKAECGTIWEPRVKCTREL